MTDTYHKFLKRLKGMTLSANERLQMRERLAMYADMHPAMAPAASGFSFFAFIGSRRFSTYAMALLLLVVAGSGITLAANASVPGDSLYAVKVDVNEPLMTALASTPKGQATVAAQIATRRVDEAVILANRGALTPERQTYLSTQFDKSAKIATEKADDLAQIDSLSASDVKANFAADLAGEAQALGAVDAKDRDGTGELLSVVVATSQNIADQADGVTIALESTTTEVAEATTTATATASTVRVMGAARLLKAPSTTASTTATTTATTTLKVVVTGRFGRHLRIASTTFNFRLASTTLGGIEVIMPRIDVAIPSLPATPAKPGDDANFEIENGD